MEDFNYLSGWGHKKDVEGVHYATSGNLGKMAGPLRQEFLQKQSDTRQMKEIWLKTNTVK